MKKGIGFLIILTFLACNKNEPIVYLQQNEIQLVAPRISVNSVLIDSFVTLNANMAVKGTEIYYTKDGTIPTDSSLKYLAPLKVKAPGTYQFASFHQDFKPSESSSISFYKKGLTIDEIRWQTQPNAKYVGQGDLTLINQQKGPMNFGNDQWVGFDTVAKAEIKFKVKTHINTINLGYLSDPSSWIFPPKSVSVVIDGNEKSQQVIAIEGLNKLSAAKQTSVIIPIDQKVNTIAIKVENLPAIPDWHDGKGQKAWLFMDEWIFN